MISLNFEQLIGIEDRAMAGTYIDITATDGSGQFKGYLATPETGSGPGILLLQEIFGIN